MAFDELTQFSESQYRYLFSRLRRLQGSNVPLRMRAASNPGGEGHQWVYERFIVGGRSAKRLFVPAGLDDNPYVDRAEYIRSLSELDDVTQDQLLRGLWVVDPTGKPFQAEWWAQGRNRYHIGDGKVKNLAVARYISWDTASKDREEHAYTACTVGELMPDYRMVVREVWRDKLQFPDLEQAATRSYGILETCVGDYLSHRNVPLARVRPAALAAWTACHGLATVMVDRQNAWDIVGKDPMKIGHDVFSIFIAGLDHQPAAA